MIRHDTFFDALGQIDEKTPEWNSVFAGLSVMRLVDRVASRNEAKLAAHWPELSTARSRVEAVSVGDPVRAILSRVIDDIEKQNELTGDIGSCLLAYGRALDLDARWALAVDVFKTIAEIFSPRWNARLIIEACTALGAAARSAGDWETSARGYAQAEHLAESIGDKAGALTVQVGLANSHMIRGNLPAAQQELDHVLKEAEREGIEQVRALAMHASASVAHSRGDYQRAIHLAYRSLELTTNPSARDRIVADIAAAYAGLGMRDTARDGYSIVAMTSPHQWVRWQATLNLMELAIQEGDESSFDRYVEQMKSASLDPKLRAYYLYFIAMGSMRFHRGDAQVLFDSARQFAEEHELNQIAFEIEAEREREAMPPSERDSREIRTFEPSGELLDIAEVLEHLRDRVESGS